MKSKKQKKTKSMNFLGNDMCIGEQFEFEKTGRIEKEPNWISIETTAINELYDLYGIKLNCDYCYMKKYGQIIVLAQSVFMESIMEVFNKHNITIKQIINVNYEQCIKKT